MKNKIKPVVHERQVKKQRSGVFFAILLVGLFFGVQIDVIYAAEIKSACIVGGQGIWNATTGKCACVVAGKVPNAQGYCADPIINNAYENDGGGAGAAAYAPDAGTESIYNRPLTSGETTQPQTKKLSYTLLESFPGFFQGGKEMTDLPTMILAIYKFGIWTVGIAGLFMLVVGGFMYMASAGNTSTASSARGIITDSLIGIIAAMGAYLILYVINPDLTKINVSFTPVNISDSEDAQVSGSVSKTLGSRNGKQLDSSFIVALNKLEAAGIKANVTSGLRSVEAQKAQIIANCGGFPPTRSCTPPTCLLKDGASSCPHTTGNAADIWALNSDGSQAAGSRDQCMANIQACFNNPKQKALITGMRAEGFCVLSSEPWHFEKPKMSTSCT